MSTDREAPRSRGVAHIEALDPEDPLRLLHDDIRSLLLRSHSSVPYHGWLHAAFVTTHAMQLAVRHDADVRLVSSAALVHDLNYLVRPNSEPQIGDELAAERLHAAGFSDAHVDAALSLIEEANLPTRGQTVSLEAACLSDSDTLFKVLPLTPILLTPSYLAENNTTLKELAEKIVSDQLGRLDGGYYFYFDEVKRRYEPWARESVSMWQRVVEALQDGDLGTFADDVQALQRGDLDVQ